MRGKLTLLDEINICLLYIQLNENTDKYTTRLSWSINAPCVLCHYEAEKRPARFCFIQMMRATEKFPLFQIDLKLMGNKKKRLNLTSSKALIHLRFLICCFFFLCGLEVGWERTLSFFEENSSCVEIDTVVVMAAVLTRG